MKPLFKIYKTVAKADVEEQAPLVAEPEFKIPIVTCKAKDKDCKHKVIQYGYKVKMDGPDGPVVPEMYQFQYCPDPNQEEDLRVGFIPASFSAGCPVDDNLIYFHTREGSIGPEYQCVYTVADPNGSDIPAYSFPPGVGEWNVDVDELWVQVLGELEQPSCGYTLLSDEAIEYLDADPLWLFGIADPATQRALDRTSVVPMLLCRGKSPCLDEWFAYLNADAEEDEEYTWVVESFAELDLPLPWTSFKGAGDVVCYWNNDTNETTAKHPFYDYFAQLLEHCRRATNEEHIKLRINRVLWSYEAESQTDVQSQMPLVSPKYVMIMGHILKVDLKKEPFMVRTLKTFLKAFSQMYHEGELDVQEIMWCLQIVGNEQLKNDESSKVAMTVDDMDDGFAMNSQLYCIECPDPPDERHSPPPADQATCYCPQCMDYFCAACFERLHEKGNRQRHVANYIVKCSMCHDQPAMLQCTYTQGMYCRDCYEKKHRRTLPKFLDLHPLKIDYKSDRSKEQTNGPLGGAAKKPSAAAELKNRIDPAKDLDPEAKESFSKAAPVETLLGMKWHAFYDLRGVKYYYNFETEESMRRPQDEKIVGESAEELENHAARDEILGFIAMSKAPRMLEAWAEGHGQSKPPVDSL